MSLLPTNKKDERLQRHNAIKRQLYQKGIIELTPAEANEYIRMERLEELKKFRELRKRNG